MAEKTLISADYHPPEGAFDGRVVLVTGATGGIGEAVSRRLAAAGATVVILDKELKALEQLYDRLVEEGCPEPAIYPMNLEGASFDNFPEVALRIREGLGRLDGLLHAAAALGKPAPIELYDTEAWYQTLQVNLNAAFMLTQACLPLLRDSDRGAILLTTDASGRGGKPYGGAYTVANAGLEGLMRVLAKELAESSSVCVNSLDPGIVASKLRAKEFPFERPEELTQPHQVAGAFVRLLGPEGRAYHGQALTVIPSEA
ncbi:MAG: SDR family NAD(P)-dependent oxidoreductase [Halorhodospira sp.]